MAIWLFLFFLFFLDSKIYMRSSEIVLDQMCFSSTSQPSERARRGRLVCIPATRHRSWEQHGEAAGDLEDRCVNLLVTALFVDGFFFFFFYKGEGDLFSDCKISFSYNQNVKTLTKGKMELFAKETQMLMFSKDPRL